MVTDTITIGWFAELTGETLGPVLQNTKSQVVMQLDLGNAMVVSKGNSNSAEVSWTSYHCHMKPYSIEAGKENPQDGYRP